MDGEGETIVTAAPAQVGRLTQCGESGVQARDESVRFASRRRLGPADRAGKIGGKRQPGDEHLARGRVDGESATNLERTACGAVTRHLRP